MNNPIVAGLLVSALCAWATNASAAPATPPLSFPDQVNMLDAQSVLINKRTAIHQQLVQEAIGEYGNGMPRVVSVFGFDNAMVAKIILSDGSTRTFRENQLIMGTLKIVSISGGGVYVTIKDKKGVLVQLPFASTASGSDGPKGQGAGVASALLAEPPRIAMPPIEPMKAPPAAPTPSAPTGAATAPTPAATAASSSPAPVAASAGTAKHK